MTQAERTLALGPLSGSRFALVAHGVPHGPPAGGVKEYLVRSGAHVECLFQPLGPEERGRHVRETWRDGHGRRRAITLPSRPPFTYPLDPLFPFPRRAVDVWIGFDNISTARGLLRRRRGLARQVVHWAVDFVPDRFGPGSRLTRAYDALDRTCCSHADLRVEVSQLALEGRNARLDLDDRVPALAVPIGLWAGEARQVPADAHARRRAVFIGHLVERMGVDTAISAVALLRDRGVKVHLDIVGRGPAQEELEALVATLGLEASVTFQGYQVGRDLERQLAEATIALAPYRDDHASFTRFADPSKLKSYLAAGLPIVLTDVPPNARELEASGAAVVAADSPEAFAGAIEAMAVDEARWQRMRAAALAEARRYDWPTVMAPVLERLGYAAAG
jgi:glycosyltransferase involved in cell wall biosynthesis